MRAGVGEEFVAGVYEFLEQGGSGELGEVALETDVVPMLYRLRFQTKRPRCFCCTEFGEDMIFPRAAVSRQPLTFSDIMYCSSQI